MNPSSRIYHLADAVQWQESGTAGYLGSADDRRDGFIHFSTAATVRASAAKHRAGQTGLLLLAVETRQVAEALKWEPARGGLLFPHLYRPLFVTDVCQSWPVALDHDGKHLFPEEIA